MAVNEEIVTGRKFRKLIDEANKLWQRISFWTKSSDVEFDDGNNAETKLGAIDGITDSLVSTSSRIAASAKAINTLSNNLTTLTDNGVIKGMEAREDGVYITYTNGADTVTKKLGEPTIKTQTISSGRLGNTGYTYTMVFNQLSKVSGIKYLSARGYSTPQIQEDSSCHVTIPNSNKVTITLPYGNSYYEYSCTAFEIAD